MAHQSNLAEWLLGRKDRIDFNVTEYTWVEDYAPEYRDFGVTIDGGIVGRAIDRDAETSLNKAIAEAIERATCVHRGLTKSTGVAAHPDLETAFENARRELIERIAFDIHFSQRKPFKKIEPTTAEAQRAVADFSELGTHYHFFELISPPGLTVICAVAMGENYARPFGGMYGFGCHEDPARAERAALFESLRNTAFYTRDTSIENLTIEDFGKLDAPKFFDRFRLALNPTYHREISFLFGESNGPVGEFPKVALHKQEIEKAPEFSDAPLFVVRVTSDYQFSGAANMLPSFMD